MRVREREREHGLLYATYHAFIFFHPVRGGVVVSIFFGFLENLLLLMAYNFF